MIEVFPVTLPRLSGKQSRRVYVYVPDALAADPDARYPVLYMFDGHNVFFDQDATYGKSWGMKEYMDQTQTPLIIVAVECNHAPNNARLSEYSPFTFQEENLGRIRGRGKWTMEWLVQELKPMIDAQYPTLPQREATFIAGSSMGGLMSLYALVAYNHVFSRAARAVAFHLAGFVPDAGTGPPGGARPGHRAVHGLRFQGIGQSSRHFAQFQPADLPPDGQGRMGQ